ncbi:DUF4388 domain-containing protein [Chloroflexus sp.]|uniref:DUF4388 domain-containing protein n=1 Tax=Chloroflexus sp. TaxID=1904827 RepID=UPI002610B0B0|nr:DUF4388 domain-containing protein [uncultured Chloroflexus sp.]
MALHGTLQQIALRELIDLAAYSALTGSIDIHGERSGRIFFVNGQIYHIECEGQAGIEALGILLNVQNGTFNVVSGAQSNNHSVWGDLESILRNAERVALRWRRLWHQAPSLELTPVLLMPSEAAKSRAGAALHVLIEAIDGRKRLRDLAAELRWSAIDVVEGVVQLMSQQIARLEAVAAECREQPSSAPAAAQPKPPATPTIDRLLALLRQ